MDTPDLGPGIKQFYFGVSEGIGPNRLRALIAIA